MKQTCEKNGRFTAETLKRSVPGLLGVSLQVQPRHATGLLLESSKNDRSLHLDFTPDLQTVCVALPVLGGGGGGVHLGGFHSSHTLLNWTDGHMKNVTCADVQQDEERTFNGCI